MQSCTADNQDNCESKKTQKKAPNMHTPSKDANASEGKAPSLPVDKPFDSVPSDAGIIISRVSRLWNAVEDDGSSAEESKESENSKKSHENSAASSPPNKDLDDADPNVLGVRHVPPPIKTEKTSHPPCGMSDVSSNLYHETPSASDLNHANAFKQTDSRETHSAASSFLAPDSRTIPMIAPASKNIENAASSKNPSAQHPPKAGRSVKDSPSSSRGQSAEQAKHTESSDADGKPTKADIFKADAKIINASGVPLLPSRAVTFQMAEMLDFCPTQVLNKPQSRWDGYAIKGYELPKPGDIIDNYRIENHLGNGGFGAVYSVTNLSLGRMEAMKLILPSDTDDRDEARRRFRREINLVSRLEHPNIVRLYSSGILERNIMWMTMELIGGSLLSKRIQTEGAMGSAGADPLMLQILSGLWEAHCAGIIHRDLKPANIMIDTKSGYSDHAVILDFGLAKAIGVNENSDVQDISLPDSRMIYGSPQYMAPELFKSGIIGPWTDVYAAGMIYFELLTGYKAVDSLSVIDAASRQIRDPIAIPPELADSYAADIIKRACAKDVKERYRNAREMAEDLIREMAAHHPESALGGFTLIGIRSRQDVGSAHQTNLNENNAANIKGQKISPLCILIFICCLAAILIFLLAGYLAGLNRILF